MAFLTETGRHLNNFLIISGNSCAVVTVDYNTFVADLGLGYYLLGSLRGITGIADCTPATRLSCM